MFILYCAAAKFSEAMTYCDQQVQAQALAQGMLEAHAQSANQHTTLQHAVASQRGIVQARHAQGVSPQQQLLLYSGQQQQFQSGQAQALQVRCMWS